MTEAEIAAFIRANLPLVAVPPNCEIRLHRARPDSGLRRLAEQGADGPASPYWAYPWPGGLGLARHIFERPELVRSRRILDLGSGSGLVAIAAMKAGAAEAMAAETDPHARVALNLNAEANGASLTIVADDLLEGAPPGVELVLVGDLFYESRLADRVTAFLSRCRASGIEVLIGDVGRTYLPNKLLKRIADYPVVEFGVAEGGETTPCGIFRLEAI